MIFSRTIQLATTEAMQLVDITEEVKAIVRQSEFQNGFVVVGTAHTTASVVINEHCRELQRDMIDFLKQLAPAGKDYRHDKVAVDRRPNTHSHLLSLLLSSQQALILSGGELSLHNWQSIFLIELDGPRSVREVRVTIVCLE